MISDFLDWKADVGHDIIKFSVPRKSSLIKPAIWNCESPERFDR